MITLVCDINGDKRFSPQFCYVNSFGTRNSIEGYYQQTRVFIDSEGGEHKIVDWRDEYTFKERGMVFSHYELPSGLPLGSGFGDESLIEQYYCLLWYKFFKRNEHLIDYAAKYSRFATESDIKHPYTQAHIVRDMVSHGLEYIKSRGEQLEFLIKLYAKESSK